MRVKLRDELDFSQRINIRRLSPAMKIYAGFVSMWRETGMYKKKINRKMEAATMIRMQKDDSLKHRLLAQIFVNFSENSKVAADGKECDCIVISVHAEYKKSLDRVLKHRDFLPYDIEMVEENPDFRKAFKDMPYLIRVRKKLI